MAGKGFVAFVKLSVVWGEIVENGLVLQVRERCKDLVLSDEQVSEMMKRLLGDVDKGLGKDSHASSIVKCFITYVQDLPNGKGE